MKILAIGDITSPGGVEHLRRGLWKIREKYGIDFCVVNGENASVINGISKEAAETLLMSGADVITGGNHTMHNYSVHSFLEEEGAAIIRPVNFGDKAPGRGYTVIDTGTYRVLVINAMGNIHIDPVLDAPYQYIDKALRACEGEYDIAILDIHAEATGEKLAVAHSYDGRINVIFGTHTHVPTADYTVLPRGTGYVTDLGMCGESGGILGMDIGTVLYKLKTRMPTRLKPSAGECFADGVIFTLDGAVCTDITRIKF